MLIFISKPVDGVGCPICFLPKQSGQCISALRRLPAKGSKYQAEKEVPQPQVSVAFGLLKEKPRLLSPSSQSISMPSR